MPQMSKISKNNTRILKGEDGSRTVRLHRTDIVSVKDGVVQLNSGGWHTYTTKARMNQTSSEWGLGFGVYQEKGSWFVRTASEGVQAFQDGMSFRVS